MFILDEIKAPLLGLTGFEADMTEEERFIQENVHRFAAEVMRPIGEKLDKMTPEEVIAPDSPLWTFYDKLEQSGLVDLEMLASLTNLEKSRIMPIIFEEMGWGDAGLTIAMLVAKFPGFIAYASGNQELIEKFGNLRGCLVATQPDRGSDLVDVNVTEIYPGAQQSRGNLHARIDGDDVVLNGQSSAWVSAGPVADCGVLWCGCDYGEGLFTEDGGQNMISMLVPFDLDGVTKGKPLDKLGQRSLCQGEIYFDNVRVPKSYVLEQKEASAASFYGDMTFANMGMGMTFTGVARAAYEEALAYAHERKQGGVPLIQHQSVRLRLFGMMQKVEACRAMSQRIVNYNFCEKGPHLAASITSKTFVTQNAFDVTSEALQMFGGNGLTREYPMEKLLRDARASMIEDGENYVLSMKAMSFLSQAYKETNQ